MERTRSGDATRNAIAILLIPVSILVLLTNKLVYQVSILADANPGVITEIAFAVGWLLLISSTLYLFVGVRRYIPLVKLT